MKSVTMVVRTAVLACLAVSGLIAQDGPSVYGYFSTRLEKSFSVPSAIGGGIHRETAPGEWSSPYFNLMISQQISPKAKIYVNLNGAKASTIDVRNYWGEYSFSDMLTVRAGKIYRKFGLYNEILDAVPTYYGIEAPELFDADHLILSRTTTLMAYGHAEVAGGMLNYSASTDNGESGSPAVATPFGIDLNYRMAGNDVVFGVSAYTSGGSTVSDVDLGSGSPKSGVLPWMASDRFTVIDGYAEANIGAATFQAEYAQAPHTIERDPAKVVSVITNAGVNAAQTARFLVNPAGPVAVGNVRVADEYTVQTFYFRGGYSIETSFGELAPYLQWDWYKNVETISSKSYGGDDEAGEADDGQFNKATLGVVFRPIPEIALKLDGSSHMYRLNGSDVSYTELRFDVSCVFGQ